MLRYAASIEATTRHPIADAVTQAAKDRGLPVPVAGTSITVPGYGVVSQIDGLKATSIFSA